MTGPTQTPPCPECAPGAAHPHIEPSLLHVHLTPYGYLLYTPGHERPSFVESMREAAYRAGYAEAVARLRDDEPAKLCGWRGFASGDGCIRRKDHKGGHGFSDGSGEQDEPIRPSLYAYRCDEDMDYTIAREKGAPVTGWLHAGGGPPWRVLVAESREQAEVFHPPHTTVEVYDGDEPTILITEAYPMLFRQSDQP